MMGMPGRGHLSRFFYGYQFIVSEGLLENILRRKPTTVLDFAKVPGMTFAAGKVASGLIYRQIVFRTGQVHRSDQTKGFPVDRF